MVALLASVQFSATQLLAQPSPVGLAMQISAIRQDQDDETDLIDDWQYNPSPRETESLGAVYSRLPVLECRHTAGGLVMLAAF